MCLWSEIPPRSPDNVLYTHTQTQTPRTDTHINFCSDDHQHVFLRIPVSKSIFWLKEDQHLRFLAYEDVYFQNTAMRTKLSITPSQKWESLLPITSYQTRLCEEQSNRDTKPSHFVKTVASSHSVLLRHILNIDVSTLGRGGSTFCAGKCFSMPFGKSNNVRCA